MIDFDEQVKKYIADCLAVKEHFITQYLVATGYNIQDCELVEQRVPTTPDGIYTTKYYMQLREDKKKDGSIL